MKIFEWEVSNTSVVIIGVSSVFGGGACYAILKYLLSSKCEQSLPRRNARNKDGEPDTDLPIVLEQEFGNFRRVCLEVDPIAARYLQEIPDHFFAFPENFAKLVSDFATKHAKQHSNALVVGSGTGYLVFCLAKIFSEVKGIEKSFSQVVTCFQFQNLDSVTYHFPAEGAQKTLTKIVKSPLAAIAPVRSAGDRRKKNKENIEFIHADLDNLIPSYLGSFQLLVLRNCLEDLDDPLSILVSVKNSVLAGGILVISSDYNWKRQLNKPVGFKLSEISTSIELFKHILDADFKLLEEKSIPEITCDSTRSCKIRYNHVTVWLRLTAAARHRAQSPQ